MARPAYSVGDIPELTDVQQAYLAGFLDGEGHFAVQQTAKRPNGRRYYVPILQVSQSGERGMELIKQLFNEVGCVGTLIYEDRSNKSGSQKDCLVWMMYGEMVSILCRQMHPYLRLKKRHAEVLMDWPRRRVLAAGRGKGTHADPETALIQAAFHAELRVLNKRGRT